MADQPEELRLNDDTDYQMCFVCGPRNPAGLHLNFRREGEEMVAEYAPNDVHQGYPGLVHGGAIYAALDETIGRLGMLRRQWLMTMKLEVRYRAPFPVAEQATIRATVVRWTKRALEGKGVMQLSDGTIVAEARGLFVEMPEAIRAQAEKLIPGFADWFSPQPASGA
jgi:acyl-coenzyme A thioesterase PaaI-like protein